MSLITVFEIKDQKLRLSRKHFREVLRMINEGKYLGSNGRDIDCGYLLIDYSKKVLVSNQSGFALHHVRKERLEKLREWCVLEV